MTFDDLVENTMQDVQALQGALQPGHAVCWLKAHEATVAHKFTVYPNSSQQTRDGWSCLCAEGTGIVTVYFGRGYGRVHMYGLRRVSTESLDMLPHAVTADTLYVLQYGQSSSRRQEALTDVDRFDGL